MYFTVIGCSDRWGEPLSHQLPNIPKNIQTISEPYPLQTNPEWARRTFQRVSASANPNMCMLYPDGGGSYEQVSLCSITRARALILPHSFACYCFSIPKPATGRGENVSLTWLIYNMLKNSPTESFFQKFFIFFSFPSRRAYARQIMQTSAFSQLTQSLAASLYAGYSLPLGEQ